MSIPQSYSTEAIHPRAGQSSQSKVLRGFCPSKSEIHQPFNIPTAKNYGNGCFLRGLPWLFRRQNHLRPDNVHLEHGDVFIEATHSGLWGTDEHYLKSGQVLGHEGIGIVKAVGPGATSARVGDRVGFGYTHSICWNCDNCASGKFPLLFPSLYFFISQ